MFFLKKIFQKNLNIDEIEDLLFDNGVEPKFADLIISKIKENKSQEEDMKKELRILLFSSFSFYFCALFFWSSTNFSLSTW